MANVYKRRNSLAEFLKDLPTGFIVAVGPDHPLLLRASDLLIGGRGLMTALFLPTAAERRNPSLLKTRFVLNRLALPPHTRHILVAEPADLKLAGQLEHDFDAVLTWSDRGIVARFAQDGEFRSRHENLPPETVAAVRQQYGDALQITQIMQWLDERRRRGESAPESIDLKPYPGDRGRRIEERSIAAPEAYNVPVERFRNAMVSLTTPLIFLPPRSCADSYRFPTRSGNLGMSVRHGDGSGGTARWWTAEGHPCVH
jgi:hypothetical protein